MFRSAVMDLAEHPLRDQVGAESEMSGVVPAFGAERVVKLTTTSRELGETFSLIWPTPQTTRPPDVAIVALAPKGQASAAVEHLTDQFVPLSILPSCTSYSQIKVALRHQLIRHYEPSESLFAHAATLRVAEKGVAIFGASGAGKSAISGAILNVEREASMVNDDWGPLDLPNGVATFMGEQRLHMKLGSLGAVSRSRKQMNEFSERQDSEGRVVVTRDEAFGNQQAESAPISGIVLIVKSDVEPQTRPLNESDMSAVADGKHSPWYGRREQFLDGARPTDTSLDRAIAKRKLLAAFTSVPAIVLNNNETPERGAASIIRFLERL